MFIKNKLYQVKKHSNTTASTIVDDTSKIIKTTLSQNITELEEFTKQVKKIQSSQNELIKSLEKLAQSAQITKK